MSKSKVEEYLVYASQCRLMAEWSDNADDRVNWRNLANLWYERAMEEVAAHEKRKARAAQAVRAG